MKLIKIATISMMLMIPIYGFAGISKTEDVRTTKAANQFCSTNEECVDVVSMELDGMYWQGLNERDPVSIGTLINRKDRSLKSLCEHMSDKKICETYKNQLMLKYMTGLLDR